jgi:hypothetical protein
MRSNDAEGRKTLLENVSRQWARHDPQAALHWANNITESGTRDAVLPGIVAVVAESDPREAAKLVSQMSSGEAQSSATGAIAWQWAGDDPKAGEPVGVFICGRQKPRARFRELDESLVAKRSVCRRGVVGNFARRSVSRHSGRCLHPPCRYH